MALLRIKNGVEAGTALTLRKGTLRVGRSEANDLQISEPSVSGSHCEVALDDTENLLVRDLGSSAGTFIEGQRITEALLIPGQRLRLGGVELVLESTSPRTPSQSAVAPNCETDEDRTHALTPLSETSPRQVSSRCGAAQRVNG